MLCQLLINELGKFASDNPIWIAGVGKITGIVNIAVIVPTETNTMVIDCWADDDGNRSLSSKTLLSMLGTFNRPHALIRVHVTGESYSDLMDIADIDPITWHKDGTAEINIAAGNKYPISMVYA